MMKTVKAFYSDGGKNCLLNVLNLGEAKADIKKRQNEDYSAWLNALIHLGVEVGMPQPEAKNWAGRFIIIIDGALVIQRLTSNKQTFEKHMEYEQKQFQQFLNS